MLEPPEQLEGLKTLGAQLFAQNGFYLEDIQIMRANATRFDELDGLFVGEAAKRVGMDVWEFYARLVVESHRNARVLSTYVDVGLFEFEEAVRKMTGAPAERLGWSDRGFVRDGCAADLVVLDRAQLRDRATFESPARFPTGIEKVFVGGVLVVDGDRYDASALAGQVLRS
ncbi:MAG: N-acyl-D-aspartate/D-glutamate deacylase [Candidatus Binatia bacterium]